MKSVVVYASRSGNTRTLAEAMARVLMSYGSSRAVAAEDASATVWAGADLIIVGGPTEGRHATPPVHAFFDRLPAHALRGIEAAAFDTRLAWPRVLSGSAASDIAKWLRGAGATLVTDDESFIVSMEPRLESGELERSLRWIRDVGKKVHPVSASRSHGSVSVSAV